MPPLFQAVLWFCGTMAGFAGMAISARELHTTMSTFEILFFRSLIGVIAVLPFVMRNQFHDLRTIKFRFHGFRALVQFSAQLCWMYGILHLTLSDLTAIEFSVPVFTAILAVMFLGETMWKHKWISTILGFFGVLIILQPEGSAFSTAGFVMLLGSFLYAGSGVLVKYLTRTESPQSIIFYMNTLQLPLGLIPAIFIFDWVTPELIDIPWILAWGLAGLAAHYTMARALKLADITIIFPLDFLRLPLMAILGYLIYTEAINPWTAVGGIVIFGANYYSVREESRRGGSPGGH
ncbi:MAG: Riboflavin transporter [Alphaproteobacteria bacterium MarineAlpha11_Bin1]|nr:MAG: Riboflavin transporter [Alphaproteobacteria bacterium MarineAlpha11_Bin1]